MHQCEQYTRMKQNSIWHTHTHTPRTHLFLAVFPQSCSQGQELEEEHLVASHLGLLCKETQLPWQRLWDVKNKK